MSEPRPVQILHLVNPVAVPPSSDLHVAQPVTFAAMAAAIEFSDPQRVAPTVAATAYPEDGSAVPDWVTRLSPLDRSVLDLRTFEHRRKLPLLSDVLWRSRERPDVDLVVYSNVDIAVMPFFYDFLAMAFDSGIDGMVINRRTVPDTWSSPDALPQMYAAIGDPHPGRDCFAFTPAALEQYDLGDVIIGAGDVGRVLLWNIALHASNFRWYTDRHLTFHIGDDRAWHHPEMAPYHDHNNDQARAVFARLEERHGPLHRREPWSALLPRKPGYWDEWRRSVEDPPGPWRRLRGRLGRWLRARDPRRPPW